MLTISAVEVAFLTGSTPADVRQAADALGIRPRSALPRWVTLPGVSRSTRDNPVYPAQSALMLLDATRKV